MQRYLLTRKTKHFEGYMQIILLGGEPIWLQIFTLKRTKHDMYPNPYPLLLFYSGLVASPLLAIVWLSREFRAYISLRFAKSSVRPNRAVTVVLMGQRKTTQGTISTVASI